MLERILDLAGVWRARAEDARLKRRWVKLRAAGMHLGQGVNLPRSTWIDMSFCFLISIGDWCGFGEQCLILAHDAQMNEFLDAGMVGKVTIHESCHFGSRTVILPGVEIGPRTIVGAHSVVSRSLPPETVCAGSPAKPICSLDDYLARHRQRLDGGRQIPWTQYHAGQLTPDRRQEIMTALESGPVYITGGFSAELKNQGGTERTPYDHTAKPHGMQYLRERRGA